MFEDIYILYLLLKYKVNLIDTLELFSEFKEYVKEKGPLFIKLLQTFLINQYQFEDKFSEEELNKLNEILDNVNYENLDSDFHVGTGSVATVCFNENKDKVIKKIFPNIKEKIEKSTNDFIKMLNLSKFFITDLSIDEDSILEFKKLLLIQTDLELEAKNMKKMAEILNCEDIKVPRVYKINSNRIKMEYVDGLKFNDFTKKYPEKASHCKGLLFKSIRKMVDNKFVHGDLHEGNFLFKFDKHNKLILYIIDYGIVFKLNDDQQKLFYNYFVSDKDKILFYYEMSNKSVKFQEFEKYFVIYEKKTTFEIFEIMKKNKVKFNFYYTTFLVGLNNLKVKLDKIKT